MKSFKVKLNSKGIEKIPNSNGVYIFGCGKRLDYIGSSGNIRQRVSQHRRNGVDSCYVKGVTTRTRKEAFDLERHLIGNKCPSGNKTKPRHCNGFWENLFRY